MADELAWARVGELLICAAADELLGCSMAGDALSCTADVGDAEGSIGDRDDDGGAGVCKGEGTAAAGP